MPIGVNLLPWREIRARRQRRHLWLLTGLAGLAGLAITAAIAMPISEQNTKAQQRQTGLREDITALEPDVEHARHMDRQLDRLDARQSAADRLLVRRTRAIDSLTGAMNALSASITLIHLDQRPDRLVIEARSADPAAIPGLIDALRATPGFAGFRIRRLANQPAESAVGQRFRLVLERRVSGSADDDR